LSSDRNRTEAARRQAAGAVLRYGYW